MRPSRAKIRLIVTILFLLVLVVGSWWQLKGGPPRKIVFAAGDKGGAYYQLALRYQEELARSGLEVQVLETKGSVENLQLVEDGRADIAFAQSGLKGRDRGDLRSLGAMFFEPVWIFQRGATRGNEMSGLKGKRVAIGELGSGTREVAMTLLNDNKLSSQVKLVSVGGEKARDLLLARELDALFLVGAPSIATVKQLANTDGISMIQLTRAKAYSRYHGSLTDVTLFRGMLNLATDIPRTDRQMVATSANLVVSDRFHYALVTLVLQTAKKIHRPAGAFNLEGAFPAARPNTFPLVSEAQEFYNKGPSFFYRNLPFFVAANLDRLIFFLLPLITLLFPLSKILPPFLDWLQNRDINRLQGELAHLELNREGLDRGQAREKLEALRDDIWELKKMPPDHQNDVFLLQLRYERLQSELGQKEEDRPTPFGRAKRRPEPDGPPTESEQAGPPRE